ncbi:hypothetical protein KJ641_04180 [Patescibacteria group bacterium]|nr:hypothetical protein [Patescibacteria group bacterium]MBU1896038.1 hypothetical protein [Patescibacteria group bacterium]
MIGQIFAYRYAVLSGVLSSLCLFLIQHYHLVWFFVMALILLISITIFLFILTIRRFEVRRENILLILTTIFAFVGLTSLIEWREMLIFLNILCGFAVGLIFFITIHRAYALRHESKPWRRIMMMLWVFDCYALATVILAFGIFFPGTPYWILAILIALVYALISVMIWKMYFAWPYRNFTLWFLVVLLVMSEIVWAMHYLPLGYLVLGVFITWIWYIIQIFVRFNLSKRGIIWKNQLWFLLSNAVLYILLLFFFAKWL